MTLLKQIKMKKKHIKKYQTSCT